MFKWAKEQKIYDAGFAKGLMFGKAVATKDEQERIIKLLEADQHIWRERIALVALIALIKGEK